jgi:general secretion pathway protein G
MQIRNARRPLLTRGFTLIEIMVVVVIIGLLAAIVAPNVINRLDDAAIARAKQDIRSLESTINLFRVGKFRYPTEQEGLEILLGGSEGGLNGETYEQYLNTMPVDPWNREYLYANPSKHGLQFDVYTLGADGQEGGEGVDADIGNWNLNE